MKWWVFVDVGIVNLAFAVVLVTDRDEWRVVHVERVDITRLPSFPGEKYPRSREVSDRMERFFHAYGPTWFDPSDRIYVERQPPTGLGHVEQFVFARYRDKCSLVSPRSMHRFLGYSKDVGYDERKRRNTIVATGIMEKHASPEMLDTWTRWVDDEERVHDISDCLCFAKYETSKLPARPITLTDGRTLMEHFGYKKPNKSKYFSCADGPSPVCRASVAAPAIATCVSKLRVFFLFTATATARCSKITGRDDGHPAVAMLCIGRWWYFVSFASDGEIAVFPRDDVSA